MFTQAAHDDTLTAAGAKPSERASAGPHSPLSAARGSPRRVPSALEHQTRQQRPTVSPRLGFSAVLVFSLLMVSFPGRVEAWMECMSHTHTPLMLPQGRYTEGMPLCN